MIQRFSHTSHLVRGDQLVLVGGVSHAQEPGNVRYFANLQSLDAFQILKIPLFCGTQSA